MYFEVPFISSDGFGLIVSIKFMNLGPAAVIWYNGKIFCTF